MRIYITKHAEDRAKERCGLKKKAIPRIADRVYDNGIKISITKGKVKEWLIGKYQLHPTSEVILYGDKAWIFGESPVDNADVALVTIIQIPSMLQKDVNKAAVKA